MVEFKTGDIIFFKTKFKWHKPSTWLSLMIRKIARIEYNHVGIIVNNWYVPFVNEAVGRGVIPTPLSKRLRDSNVLVKRPNFDIDERKFAIEANSFLGYTKYDVIGLVFHQLMWNLFGVWVGTNSESMAKKRFYCYEYAAYLYRSKTEWIRVRPKDFVKSEWMHTVYSNGS